MRWGETPTKWTIAKKCQCQYCSPTIMEQRCGFGLIWQENAS